MEGVCNRKGQPEVSGKIAWLRESNPGKIKENRVRVIRNPFLLKMIPPPNASVCLRDGNLPGKTSEHFEGLRASLYLIYYTAGLRLDGEVRSHASWMTHCDRLRMTDIVFRKWLENHSPEYSERHFHLN